MVKVGPAVTMARPGRPPTRISSTVKSVWVADTGAPYTRGFPGGVTGGGGSGPR